MAWIDVDKGNVQDGAVRLKWPDGYVGTERVRGGNLLCSHRGVEFAAPMVGLGFQVDDGKPDAPAQDKPPMSDKPQLPPGVPNPAPSAQPDVITPPPPAPGDASQPPPPDGPRRVDIRK